MPRQPARKAAPPAKKAPVLRDLHVLERVTRAVAVQALGIPDGSFSRLMADRILPVGPEKGVHNLRLLFAAFVAYLDVERAENGKTSDPEMRAERLRYLRAHADVEELAAEQRAGALIALADAELIASEALGQVSAEMDGAAGRLARDVAAITDPAEVRKLLLDEYRDIRSRALATLARLRAPVRAPEAAGDGDPYPAADSDG